MSAVASLLLAFFVLCTIGVFGAFLVPERSNPALLAALGSLAAGVLLALGTTLFFAGNGFRVALWPLLTLGTLALRGDTLSGLFLFVAGMVFLPVSVFSAVYLPKYANYYSLRYFSVLYYALFASVVLVLIAGDVISFLSAWEAMSIASYLLVNYEHGHEGVSHAGMSCWR